MSDISTDHSKTDQARERGTTTSEVNSAARGNEPATQPATDASAPVPLALTVLIPALNEAARLPPYLSAIRAYMDAHYANAYELIVVDDGSTDQSSDLLSAFASKWPRMRVLRHPHNRGKGAAVRTGVMAAHANRILYTDADGATPIEEEAKLRRALDGGADLAAGSRLLDARDVVRSRTWSRELIGRAFARLARWLVPTGIRDTQCGFKMLRAEVARDLFRRTHEDGYLFDIEILGLARKLQYRIAEVPINWSDQPGSQLNLRHQAMHVLIDLWRVRRRLQQVTEDATET